MHSKIGSDVKILSLDKRDTMAVRIVVNVFQLVQDCNAVFALLLVICDQ